MSTAHKASQDAHLHSPWCLFQNRVGTPNESAHSLVNDAPQFRRPAEELTRVESHTHMWRLRLSRSSLAIKIHSVTRRPRNIPVWFIGEGLVPLAVQKRRSRKSGPWHAGAQSGQVAASNVVVSAPHKNSPVEQAVVRRAEVGMWVPVAFLRRQMHEMTTSAETPTNAGCGYLADDVTVFNATRICVKSADVR